MYSAFSSEIAFGKQDVVLTEIGKFNGHKLEISIRSDHYRAQCHARVRVWSPVELKWNFLVGIAPSAMATKEGLVYQPLLTTRKDFEVDREQLLTQATYILG